MLLQWNGSGWDVAADLTSDQFQFEAKGAQTGLYLPFDSIGIDDPATASLKLIVVASEDDALRLWATLPSANPLNSGLVIGPAATALDQTTFALLHAYEWTSLGSGVCPNGTRTPAATPFVAADADLQVSIESEPLVSEHTFIGEGWLDLWSALFGDRPDDVASLFALTDSGQPLGNGQAVVFTLSVANRGAVTATNVLADVSSRYALRLPGGVHLPAEFRDRQVVSIGDVAPEAEVQQTFSGAIDTTTGQQYYDALVVSDPDKDCNLYRAWAAADVRLCDDAHTANPFEVIWIDQPVDYAAPDFFGIQQPEYLLAAGPNTLRGYAFDDSGVPTLTLEIGGSPLTCIDGSPGDGQWACQWDATSSHDGDTFNVRMRATDAHGQSSGWSNLRPFIVDSVPPDVTLDVGASDVMTSGSVVKSSAYRLAGQVIDNRGLGDVEVCVDGTCASATVSITDTAPLRIYDDVPATPLDINSATNCSGGQIARTFTVTDSFVVAAVDFGFNAEHPLRDDIQAELVSPLGTHVRLLFNDGITGTHYANYDVLLNDAATSAYSFGHDDDVSEPYFDREARPYAPLRAFEVQNAVARGRCRSAIPMARRTTVCTTGAA